MAQWINFHLNSSFVNLYAITFVVQKNWITSTSTAGSYGKQADRLAGRQNAATFRDFKIS